MKILLPLLLVVAAAGAVFWALAPADDAPSALSGRVARAPTPQVEIEAGDAPERGTTSQASKNAKIPIVFPPERATVKVPEPVVAELPPAKGRFVAQTPFEGTPRWGRHRKTPDLIRMAAKPIKDSIRQYYGNLSKTGPVPIVNLDELLPADVILALNLPPNGQVTELGHYPIHDRRGFTEALDISEESEGSLGITVVDERGETVREYMFFEGQK